MADVLKIADKEFTSRVLLGSSGYPNQQVMLEAIKAAEAQIVTVALRRINLTGAGEAVQDLLRAKNITLLPNTAGCFTAADAVLTAELAREALETNWIKLEVIGDRDTLLPDPQELLLAAEELVAKGFVVLPYAPDDPITCMKLADVGCAAVMPLGSPIGAGNGINNPYNISIIRERITVPLIIDAGLGTASDVAQAFELGADAVLLNTAVSKARDPVLMAIAMRDAARAGRNAHLAGRIPKRRYAEESSTFDGMVNS